MARLTWPCTDDELIAGVRQHGRMRFAAMYGGTKDSLRRELDRRGLTIEPAAPAAGRGERAGVVVRGDDATVTSEPSPDLGDVDALIRDRGLSPDDWEVITATLNEWDGPVAGGGVQKLRQLKVALKRRRALDWLFPAADIAQRPAPRPRNDPERPQTIVFLPDPHVPFHDVELDKRVGEFLHAVKPDRVISPGDVPDFSSISRHRDNPAWFATANENVQAAFEWWARKREAAPDAEMDWVEGNHDFRLRSELLTRAERMYGLKPAEIPGEGPQDDALSLRRLCHLDRLHVRFHGPPLAGDEYFHAGVDLAPDLRVLHGWLTGTSSAAATMDRLGMSVVFGHTHHQRIHYKTIYRGAQPIAQRIGLESGTLARVKGGLGYGGNPDWQQGGAVGTVWPDGTHQAEHFTYDGRALRWRGQRF